MTRPDEELELELKQYPDGAHSQSHAQLGFAARAGLPLIADFMHRSTVFSHLILKKNPGGAIERTVNNYRRIAYTYSDTYMRVTVNHRYQKNRVIVTQR